MKHNQKRGFFQNLPAVHINGAFVSMNCYNCGTISDHLGTPGSKLIKNQCCITSDSGKNPLPESLDPM